MSKHVFSAADNSNKLTLRTYGAFGFTLGVFIDDRDAVTRKGYGEEGSMMVALTLDEAKLLLVELDSAIFDAEGN